MLRDRNPLAYPDTRCPHFDAYLCGLGRTQIGSKYHGPTIVRPNLPRDPRPRGFKL